MFAHSGRLILLLASLGNDPTPKHEAEAPARRFEFVESHMGSEFKIVLFADNAVQARAASRAAFDRVAALDASFSDYNAESELSRLNARAGGPPVPVSADLFAILQRASTMYEMSAGSFDVTVGPVVRLWRRARRERKLPEPDTLERARSLVGSPMMRLDPEKRTVTLAKKGMRLDLGGIAKGYASDAALKALRDLGIRRALVAGAGDVVVGNPPPGKEGWTVGIAPLENPNAAPERSLLLRNAAVSTSGDTERFVEIGGKRYAHIVDPKTGVGLIERASATVIAPDGVTADSLATAVYALGPQRGMPLVDATQGCAAYLVRIGAHGKEIIESRRFRTLPRASVEDSESRSGP